MKNTNKKNQIKSLVKEMLNESNKTMINKIDNLLKSGCIDIEQWNQNNNSMVLPKCIVTALLQHESEQYSGKGTSFEKSNKKEINNIRYFI